MAPPDECSRDSPDKPSTQERVRSTVTALSLTLGLVGEFLQACGKTEPAQILQLSSIVLRSALLPSFRLRK